MADHLGHMKISITGLLFTGILYYFAEFRGIERVEAAIVKSVLMSRRKGNHKPDQIMINK